ncbi:MAG TPA: hypothetical protein VGO47_09590, partial [Chlamydiales bacterium]|nr:hypothetical protein [Chlamydiales bacterium]
DDGATLLMTFRALQSESQNQGEAHKTVAKDLASLVADPFGQWASGHAVGAVPGLLKVSHHFSAGQGGRE